MPELQENDGKYGSYESYENDRCLLTVPCSILLALHSPALHFSPSPARLTNRYTSLTFGYDMLVAHVTSASAVSAESNGPMFGDISMEAFLKNEWLAELLIQHRDLVTEYWIQCIRAEGITGYQTVTDEQLRKELPPTVDSMIYAFQTGNTEGPRQHSVGIIRYRLVQGFQLPDLQMSLHALQTAVMKVVLKVDVGVEKELDALYSSSMMYYMVALIAAEVYEQLRIEQQNRFTTTYEFGITLTSNLDLCQILDTAVDKVAEYMQADSVAILLIKAEEKCYELRAYHNLDTDLVGALAGICESLGCGVSPSDACIVPDVRQNERLAKWATLLSIHDRRAMACTPLYAQQEHLGRLVVLWSQPRGITNSELDFLLAMSSHIAGAIQNALLYEEAQGKRELDVLLNASRLFASSLDTRDILAKIARMSAEVTRADMVLVYTLDYQQEWSRRTAYYASDGVSKSVLNSILETLAPREEEGGFGMLGPEFVSGKPVFYVGGKYPDVLESIAGVVGSAMIIPLRLKDITLGACALISVDENAFDEKDLALARGLADLAAVAIENARLYEHELKIAETLQRSFLPTSLPSVEGYDTAAYYRPARAEAEVGGDFYDLFITNRGCMGVIIGDVSGKGLSAAVPTAMGKYMVRAYATENPSPGNLLERFNRSFYQNVPEGLFMTAFYGTLDPRQNTFTYVSAGHNPPLFYSAKSGRVTEIPIEGVCLGIIAEARYIDKEIEMQPDDVLLLYTDGATDVKNSGGRLEIEGLEELLLHCAHKSAHDIINCVSDGILEFSHGTLPDDVALVVVKRRK